MTHRDHQTLLTVETLPITAKIAVVGKGKVFAPETEDVAIADVPVRVGI